MNMQGHILQALSEEFDRWQAQLDSMSSGQIAAQLHPSQWTTKDVMAHLWAWQQRSIARLEGGLHDREPRFPQWLPGVDPESEPATDQINDWIYQTNRERPWPEMRQAWQAGFQRFLELGAQFPERDLLDPSRYPWMDGLPLALVLVASYDHHQEHLEKLQAWLQENKI